MRTCVYLFIGFVLSAASLKAQPYFLNGAAYATGSQCYVLTNALNNQHGSVWFGQQLNLNNPFDIEFIMNFGALDAPGADGMTFALHRLGTNAIGATGGAFGYSGMTPSFAVEFDTYQNNNRGDPAYDHIALIRNGNENHGAATNIAGPVSATSPITNIEDSIDHNIRVTWNQATDSIHVYFDCQLRLAVRYDILTNVFPGTPNVWWGFTGGTGGSVNRQSVCVAPSVINQMKDTIICKGDTVLFNAPPGSNYLWTPNVSISNTTIQSPLVHPSVTTMYHVHYLDRCNQPQQDSALVTIQNVNVNLGPDTNLCFGTSIGLNAGSGFITYQWQNAASGQTISAATTGTYWVKVTDSRGCKGGDTVLVTILPAISLSVLPVTPSICEGNLMHLTASGALNYSWSPATGLSVTTGSSVNASPPSTTVYTLTGSNSAGCSATTSITLTVHPLPTATVSPDAGICAGSNTQLSASGGTTYLWSPASSLNNPNISNPVASPAGNTTYTVTVTDIFGCSATASTNIAVNPFMTVGLTADSGICIGSNIPLSASGGNFYSWTPSAGLSNSSIANPVANPASTTSYTVHVTDISGCSGTATVTITVNLLPVVAISSPTSICSGSNTALNASGGVIYLWSPSTGLSNTSISNPVANPVANTNYSVIVTDANGCSSSATTSVAVNPLPVVGVNPNDSICPGSNLQLNATGGINYLWNPASGLSNSNISNPLASPGATTNYTVTVTDANSCSSSASTSVTVNPSVAVVMSSNQTICNGSNALLAASGGVSYVWNPATGLDNAGVPGPIASPTTTTNYSVVVTDANGCTGTGTITVNVNPLPVATITLSSSVCIGSGLQLNSTGGVSYLWSPATAVSNPNISNPMTTISTSTYIEVLVTDALGCSSLANTTISVNPLPIVNISPDAAICTGSNTQLTASGGVNYSWSPSGSLSSSTISNPVANPLSNTMYTVTVTNGNGCVNTASTNVSVNPYATVNLTADGSICTGSNMQLNASGGNTYSWSPATGLTNTSISNPVANPSSTTLYTVGITDANGCTGSGSVTVTVNSLPAIVINPNTSICIGSNTTLSASGGTSYLWSPSTGLNDPAISNPVANPSSNTVYSVIVTDANNCTNSANTTVTVNPLPTVVISPDAAICIGSTVQLTASGGVNYSWSPSSDLTNANISNPIASPLSNTSYSVTVTDANGCVNTSSTTITVNPFATVNLTASGSICAGSTMQLVASGGSTYSWSPSTGLTNSSISNPVANPASTTIYNVGITDANGCTGSGSVTITVNPLPTILISPNTAICIGSNTTLSASGGTSYLWNPATGLNNPASSNPVSTPVNSTTYSVIVTDALGCLNTASISVTVNLLPVVNVNSNSSICAGSSSQLIASGGVNYSWSPASGLSSSSISNPVSNVLSTTTYHVTVTDGNSCVNTASSTVVVNALPVLTMSGNAEVCEGSGIQLTSSGGISYLWSPPTGLNNSHIQNPFATPLTSSTYSLVTTDLNGCTASGSVSVSVNPLPVTTINADTLVMLGTSVQLLANGGTDYSWSPDLFLSCSDCENPVSVPLRDISYMVTVTDVNGCRNADTVEIRVEDLVTLYIPNAFTPSNADARNDFFFVQGIGIKEFSLSVFNRWGTIVFETNDLNSKWDGTFGGQPVEQGVYVYVAKVTSYSGKNISKAGSVTVLR